MPSFYFCRLVLFDAVCVVCRENEEGDCASMFWDLFIEHASNEWDDSGGLQCFGVKSVFDWCVMSFAEWFSLIWQTAWPSNFYNRVQVSNILHPLCS